ncbi:hypothetical protein V1478_014345, partial [Vespula squamosa]
TDRNRWLVRLANGQVGGRRFAWYVEQINQRTFTMYTKEGRGAKERGLLGGPGRRQAGGGSQAARQAARQEQVGIKLYAGRWLRRALVTRFKLRVSRYHRTEWKYLANGMETHRRLPSSSRQRKSAKSVLTVARVPLQRSKTHGKVFFSCRSRYVRR